MAKKKTAKKKRKVLPFKEAKKFHSLRSNRAQSIDERKKNKNNITDDRWKKRPGKFDYPGIDTPKKTTKKTPKKKFSKKLTQKEKWGLQAEKRKEWAKSSLKKADQLDKENKKSMEGIEPGQPVHSRTDRNKRERAINKNFKILELREKAEEHLEKAKHLEQMSKYQKGDLDKQRQSGFKSLKRKWKVGDTVYFGRQKSTIMKFNRKSIRIRDNHGDIYSVEPYQLEKR